MIFIKVIEHTKFHVVFVRKLSPLLRETFPTEYVHKFKHLLISNLHYLKQAGVVHVGVPDDFVTITFPQLSHCSAMYLYNTNFFRQRPFYETDSHLAS